MVKFTLHPLTEAHIEEVHAIEQDAFSQPWSREDLMTETCRENAISYVALDVSNHVAGYASMWHLINEGHINNIAVADKYRQQGVGTLLIEALIATAVSREMIGLTLEVRVGNRAAMALYHKFGFVVEGYRKNYYQHPNEDAVIMWKYLS